MRAFLIHKLVIAADVPEEAEITARKSAAS